MSLFSYHNSKVMGLGKILGKRTAAFDTSVGYTCPYANVCKCFVVASEDGKRRLRKVGEVRCFAVIAELLYPDVYWKRKINGVIIRSPDTFLEVAGMEIKQNKLEVIRVHSAGDILDLHEYTTWMKLADLFPDVMFFGYTKNYIVFDMLQKFPKDNFKMCYSWGGTGDKYVEWKAPVCYIKKPGLYTPDDVPVIALQSGDDYQLIIRGRSFAIPYH